MMQSRLWRISRSMQWTFSRYSPGKCPPHRSSWEAQGALGRLKITIVGFLDERNRTPSSGNILACSIDKPFLAVASQWVLASVREQCVREQLLTRQQREGCCTVEELLLSWASPRLQRARDIHKQFSGILVSFCVVAVIVFKHTF